MLRRLYAFGQVTNSNERYIRQALRFTSILMTLPIRPLNRFVYRVYGSLVTSLMSSATRFCDKDTYRGYFSCHFSVIRATQGNVVYLEGLYQDSDDPTRSIKRINEDARCVTYEVYRNISVSVQLMRSIRRCRDVNSINVGLISRYSKINRVTTRFRGSKSKGLFLSATCSVSVALFREAMLVFFFNLRKGSISFRYINSYYFRNANGIYPF